MGVSALFNDASRTSEPVLPAVCVVAFEDGQGLRFGGAS